MDASGIGALAFIVQTASATSIAWQGHHAGSRVAAAGLSVIHQR
jgi:hypothetical protein